MADAHSTIAAHFKQLRTRFPPESSPLLTRAHYSFDQMASMAGISRPESARAGAFEIGGTDYVIWEMGGDRFQVFTSIYNFPMGSLHLSGQPQGMIVHDGFYTDLGKLGAHIKTHFQGNSAAETGRRKLKILLFGFCKSLGHHIWNEVSGLTSCMASGLFDGVDGVIAGPFDYFNLGAWLQSSGKQVWKLNANGVIVTPDLLFSYHNSVVTEEARRLALDNAARQAPVASPGGPTICFQIRKQWRPWVREEEGLAEIINQLSTTYPQLRFIIDGHSSSPSTIAVWDDAMQLEQESFTRLQQRVGRIPLRSTIGMDVNAKLNLFRHVNMFVGGIGSGGALSSWLLRKPTLCYGPTAMHALADQQERTVPEGGPMAAIVPARFTRDLEGEKHPFDVATAPILDGINKILQISI